MAGHLHFLWWWCMDYAMDGDITKYTTQQLADAAEWEQDANEFVAALVGCGFIDRDNNSTKIHDWYDFCGELIKKRLARKDEKRQKTAENGRQCQPKSAEMPPTIPYPTIPDQTIPNQPNTKTARFEKPTAASVTEYAATISFKLDGQTFLDYYEANGWKVGRNPMKDWKATVRNWKTRRNDNGQSKAGYAAATPGKYPD
jgi:hypothetical protein